MILNFTIQIGEEYELTLMEWKYLRKSFSWCDIIRTEFNCTGDVYVYEATKKTFNPVYYGNLPKI